MTSNENSVTSSSSGAHPADHSHIELVRIFDRTIHVSTIDRKKETDFTIRNVSDQDVNYVFLPLREFKLNLQIYDEDGQRLNYYPNDEVESFVEQMKDEDEGAYQQMQHRFKHTDYQLYIQLSPDKPLKPGGLRTITLKYEQSESVSFYSLSEPSVFRGWLSQWEKKFFKIPSFLAGAKRYPGHPHDEFIVSVGTPGYSTIGDISKSGGEPADDFYENGLDDDTRVFSARLPPADDRPYEWTLQYDLIPNNRTLMLILVIYFLSIFLTGALSAILAISGNFPGLSNYGLVWSTAVITGTLGLVFALDMEWAERFRILCVIPLILHGMAWVLWTLAVPGAP